MGQITLLNPECLSWGHYNKCPHLGWGIYYKFNKLLKIFTSEK